jgi:hypothetical protein
MLAVGGLHELAEALEREEQRLGVRRSDAGEEHVAALQAAWERAELARAELDNGNPHANAQALISMNSALDAMVEELAPSLRELEVTTIADDFVKRAMAEAPHAAAQVSSETMETLREAVAHDVADHLPKMKKLSDSGTKRYERVLRRVGAAAPPGRPVPADLDEAMTEIAAIRDVLIHRAGRVDTKALAQAPTLRYTDGQFVRLSNHDYRVYSAAIRCYGAEIWYRLLRHDDPPRLQDWRQYCRVNA